MRAVLDANVVVSALISPRGAPGQVLSAWWQGRFAWITSAVMPAELSRALGYPRVVKASGWDHDRRSAFIQRLAGDAIIVEPVIRIDVCRDPDDNRVLEAAVAGSAGYIVTGDADLLDLASYEGIAIVTPARFLAVLAAAP